jgi:hypothetical protein
MRHFFNLHKATKCPTTMKQNFQRKKEEDGKKENEKIRHSSRWRR